MAATLDADQEQLVHFSFPIEKQEDTDTVNPVDGTPDIWIVGKATDGTVDADRQIVDPQWSAVALKEWAATGGNVRMSHDPKRPVGKGHDVQVTTDGHYVKSLISDPLAKHFVRTGVLNDYSVGISMPHIKFGADKNLDPQGKATGGIITGRPDGLSKIAELSIVDRGANFSSRFQITRKSAGGGDDFGFDGRMVGSQEEITKATPADLLAKVSGGDLLTKAAPPDDDLVNVDLPKSASISISPADFAKLDTFKRSLTAKAAEADIEKREVDTAERRDLASEGNALPDGSYPIKNTGDLENAAHLARTGHGDVAAARRLIARRAGELGVANPLDESDEVSKSATMTPEAPAESMDEPAAEKAGAPDTAEAATPDVTKEPGAEDAPVKKGKKKAKGPKKMPPWLKDGDGKDADDDACKSVDDHLWTGIEGTSDIECAKCHTTPAEAAKVTAAPMNPAPVGDLMESQPPMSVKAGPTPASASGAEGEHMTPVPAHREPDGTPMEALEADAGLSDGDDEKPTRLEAATGMKAADLAPDPEVAALLRFKALGADEDMGRLHDLTCPAFHPDDVAKYHPFAEIGGLIDSRAWQQKALAAAAGPIDAALKGHEVWEAALLLKTADPGDINDWRLAAYKAFRDANPGPGSFPTPGSLSPQRYARPALTAGRAANAVDYGAPTSAPQVADSAPNAASFDRPPLAAAHQSPSPSHMKGDGEYPAERGVPVQLSYAQSQKEAQRQALGRMHDHLSRQFPSVCPLNADSPVQPENHPVPVPAGIGKSAEVSAEPAEAVIAEKAQPEGDVQFFADADVAKSFKKMKKKLGKKILSGQMTVDEARARLGRQFAQKSDDADLIQMGVEQIRKGISSIDEVRGRSDGEGGAAVVITPRGPVPAAPAAAAALDPEVIKSAVAEATSELKDLLVKQQETFETKLSEQQKVIDAIADQPDPSTAAFSGLAFQPGAQKARRPAAVPDQAEYAARAQEMVRRNLQHTYSTHSNPNVREAAGEALANLGTPAVAS